MHSYRGKLVLEPHHALLGIEVRDVVLSELVYLEACSTGVGVVGWHCYQIEVALQVPSEFPLTILNKFSINTDAIERAHDPLVPKPLLNELEVFVSSKGEVIDYV